MNILHVPHAASNARALSFDLCSAALDYAARRWSVIPTIGKKSAHHWKQFQTSPADEPTLRRMFGRNGITGLAVILGYVSGGLACRDFDTVAAYQRWAAEHPDLAAVLPTVRTARGYHVYFRGPEAFHNLGDGEYRATSGQYCLLPPSRHPSGAVYSWLVPLPAGELPQLDPVQAGLLTHVQPTAETQAYTPYTLLVSDRGVETAIAATIPGGPGQRNRCLWDLARRLKGIMPAATAFDLEQIVRAWHRRALPFIDTKDWLTSWVDFRIAWTRVTKPAGATMAQIVARAKSQTPTGADAIGQLVVLCRSLQEHYGPGRAWPLSCRKAAEVIGVGHDTAARMLKLLCEEGTIELETPGGDEKSKRAAEYRFLRG